MNLLDTIEENQFKNLLDGFDPAERAKMEQVFKRAQNLNASCGQKMPKINPNNSNKLLSFANMGSSIKKLGSINSVIGSAGAAAGDKLRSISNNQFIKEQLNLADFSKTQDFSEKNYSGSEKKMKYSDSLEDLLKDLEAKPVNQTSATYSTKETLEPTSGNTFLGRLSTISNISNKAQSAVAGLVSRRESVCQTGSSNSILPITSCNIKTDCHQQSSQTNVTINLPESASNLSCTSHAFCNNLPETRGQFKAYPKK